MGARVVLLIVASGLLAGCATPIVRAPLHGSASDGHSHAGHAKHAQQAKHAGHASHAKHDTRPLLADLRRGWQEPWIHSHTSRRGTPLVHAFLGEPAFFGRDILLNVVDDGDEMAYEAEFVWAFTRRVAAITEWSYVDTGTDAGLGDGAFSLRALLLEAPRFLFSVSGEVELPTGDASRGLGSGALAAGVFAHTWVDLGGWTTLQTQTGIEVVPDEDETAWVWHAALAKSFRARPLFGPACNPGSHELDQWSLLLEVFAETPFAGEIEGEWLVGATYPLFRGQSLRAAFARSFDGAESFRFGMLLHP